MELRLDYGSSLPLHAQVEQVLRTLACQPAYARGRLLPDELELARRLAVSRGTVRTALGRLVSEGLLERRRGVGTRVRPATHHTGTQHTGLAKWQSFRAEMEARGIVVVDYASAFEHILADNDCAEALGIHAGRRIWRLTRLRGWDDEPAVEMVSCFHPQLPFQGDEVFDRGLYITLRERFGVEPMRSEERITAEAAGPALARRLRVRRGSPLLVRRRVVRDAGGRAIEFAMNRYVSARCAYHLELERRT